MSEIVPGKLWLGAFNDAYSLDKLRTMKVARVVNLAGTSNQFPQLFEYHDITIDDDDGEDLAQHFQAALDFIAKDEAPVLVYCMAGVSRSASLVLAYLMREQKLSLHDSLYRVYELHSRVSPNKGFIQQLMAFEKQLIKGGVLGDDYTPFKMEDFLIFRLKKSIWTIRRVRLSDDEARALLAQKKSVNAALYHYCKKKN